MTELVFAYDGSERTMPGRIVFGSPIEKILRETPADFAVYRSVD